ncbi:MAG: hypothetical protein ACRCVJ_05140 [Clostridium sp.]|uniref:hypothetical protein n=1 Tax=Clostridium sp. TaxID=1506 RepID=UPI003F33E1FF
MPNIVQGSKLKFEASVNIPANATFAKLVISDTLANGLSYTTGTETLTYTVGATTTTLVEGTDYTDESTGQLVKFVITNAAVVTPTAVTNVKVTIPVVVSNIVALLAAQAASPDFKNVITFEALDASDAIIDTDTAETALKFTQFQLHGLGASYTVKKLANQTAQTVFFFPAASGFADPNLVYTVEVLPMPEFTFSAPVKVTLNSVSGPVVTGATAVINPTTNKVTVTIPHTDQIKDGVFHVIVPTTTTAAITLPAVPNTLYINGTANLSNTSTTPPTLLSVASPFNAQVTLIEETQIFFDATKSLLS